MSRSPLLSRSTLELLLDVQCPPPGGPTWTGDADADREVTKISLSSIESVVTWVDKTSVELETLTGRLPLRIVRMDEVLAGADPGGGFYMILAVNDAQCGPYPPREVFLAAHAAFERMLPYILSPYGDILQCRVIGIDVAESWFPLILQARTLDDCDPESSRARSASLLAAESLFRLLTNHQHVFFAGPMGCRPAAA